MSLPAKVLQPRTRAIGMGIFFTTFYVWMMLGPAAAGAIAKWAGSAASALDFGAAMILAYPLLLWLGNRIPRSQPSLPKAKTFGTDRASTLHRRTIASPHRYVRIVRFGVKMRRTQPE